MAHIDGEKIELVIEKIYEIFKKHSITGHEGAAISSMILSTSTSLAVKQSIEEYLQTKGK